MGNILCIPRATRRGDKVKKMVTRNWFWQRKTGRSTSNTAPEASTSADPKYTNDGQQFQEAGENTVVPEKGELHNGDKNVQKNQTSEADLLKKHRDEIQALLMERIMEVKNSSEEKKNVTKENEQFVILKKELQGRVKEAENEKKSLNTEKDILKVVAQPTDGGRIRINHYITELTEEKQRLRHQLITYAESLNDVHMDKQELNDEIKKLKRENEELLKKLRIVNIDQNEEVHVEMLEE